MDVSRETAPAELPPRPASVTAFVDSERLPLLDRFAEILATDGVVRGLIGPREVPRLWERHLLNCAALADLIPPGARVCDVGSGAGLPGVVVALARPDLEVTLLEPLLRRTTFLAEVVLELGLGDQVRVHRGRAEELVGREQFGVVTARAVAPLGRLLTWCLPLVDASGQLLAMKGSSAAEEVALARPVWDRWRCATPELVTIGAGVAGAETTVVRVAGCAAPQVGWRDDRGRRPRPVRRRKQAR